MKPIDVKDNTYINIDKDINDKDPKFKVGDHVRISKYKNIFAKSYTPNWSEEIFVIKLKIQFHGHILSTLANNSVLTAVENKIPDVTNLLPKTDFDTKLKKQKSDRVTSNKSNHLLVENELKILKTFNLSYFKGKSYFEGNDGAQKASVFQTMQKHFNLSNVNQISKWKSKGLFRCCRHTWKQS